MMLHARLDAARAASRKLIAKPNTSVAQRFAPRASSNQNLAE
jgi:hypothetical protein